MQLTVSHEDCRARLHVDRDGSLNDQGRQGFDVWIGADFKIHFEDEGDVETLALRINDRLGVFDDEVRGKMYDQERLAQRSRERST